jgi:hypothetical protein
MEFIICVYRILLFGAVIVIWVIYLIATPSKEWPGWAKPEWLQRQHILEEQREQNRLLQDSLAEQKQLREELDRLKKEKH